jgi:hypothetical protein
MVTSVPWQLASSQLREAAEPVMTATSLPRHGRSLTPTPDGSSAATESGPPQAEPEQPRIPSRSP